MFAYRFRDVVSYLLKCVKVSVPFVFGGTNSTRWPLENNLAKNFGKK